MPIETIAIIALILCQFAVCGISLLVVRDVPDEIIMDETMSHGDVEALRHGSFRFGALCCLLVDVILSVILERLCLDAWNPARIVSRIAASAYSYQTMLRLSAALLAGGFLAFAVGWGIRLWMWGEAALSRLSRQTVGHLMAASTAIIVCAMLGAYGGFRGLSELSIEEICRKHAVVVEEEEEDNDIPIGAEGSEEVEAAADNIVDESYVTLTNRGALAYHLDTVYLSDDGDEPEKFTFHDITVPAGGDYRIDMDYDKGLQLTKSGGTTVYLTGRTGDTLDSVTVPALEDGTAYYKEPSGDWGVHSVDNASAMASDASENILNPPVFSMPSGFYDNEFALSISSNAGTTVHYTLDCSTPTADSPTFSEDIKVYDKSNEENRFRSIPNVIYRWRDDGRFSTPEPVDKAFIVRAVAVDENGNESAVKTASYFIGQDKYRDKAVVSLVLDPGDLFDEENGIYVTGKEYDDWEAEDRKTKTREDYIAEAKANATEEDDDWERNGNTAYFYAGPTANYMKRGDEWERLSDFTLLENGSISTEQMVGARIQGGSTRNITLKRFSLYARKEYSGSKWFLKDFFGTGAQTHSIVLREGFLNAFTPSLVEYRDVSIERAIPVSLFLDGEYWRDCYICEKFSPPYFSQYDQLTEDNIIMAKGSAIDGPTDKSENRYRDIYRFLEDNDIAQTENYEAFDKLIDVQSYIDYSCINVYLGNMDNTETKNIVIWHTLYPENSSLGDGRWRWTLHDMDLLRGGGAEVDSFSVKGGSVDTAFDERTMFMALRESKTFCQQFVNTFMDLVNTDFAVDTVSKQLKDWGEDLSFDNYFFRDRAAYITQYMAKEFKLHGSQAPITITTNDSDAGAVTLNTIQPDLSDGEWTGQYFTDYPVTVSAEPADGYEFVHWQIENGGSTKTSTKMTDNSISFGKGGVTIHVEFRKK